MKHNNKPQKSRDARFKRFADADSLKSRVISEAPPSGVYYYKVTEEDVQQDAAALPSESDKKKVPVQFADLPISQYSKQGLSEATFETMTDTQRCVVPHALSGRDVLACARTGSGKTLAFLVPVIERLYRERWTELDGLGGLVLVPTRELAQQVFDVLRAIGRHHTFSAGVVMGGNKGVEQEKERVNKINILIATPGRLLHHMNETPGFTCDNLKVLVLDEVDRILDLGFADEMDQILSNIPKTAQILLSSATLSLKIQRLAKVNLKHPEHISIHNYEETKDNEVSGTGEESKRKSVITPSGLVQYYMTVDAKDKIDVVFSFLKSHTKHKILLFLSSCKQVRYMYEALRKLRPGISLYELHGRQKQAKRSDIFSKFANSSGMSAALFATDIASRGLDMPDVDWVVQIDCPEDLDSYIHRVGRTARYKAKGNSLLMLLPSEQMFLHRLETKGIALKKINVNPEKTLTIQGTLRSYLSGDLELMKLAQKAFISYVKALHLMKDKQVFDLKKVNFKGLAASMGLVTVPVIKMGQEELDSADPPKKAGSKLSKLKAKIQKKKSEKAAAKAEPAKEPKKNEDDDDLLKVVRRIEVNEEIPGLPDIVPDKSEDETTENVPADAKKKKKHKLKIGKSNENTKVKFDEEGKPIDDSDLHLEVPKDEADDNKESEGYIDKVREKLLVKEGDIKESWKQRIAKKRRDQREKRKRIESEKKGDAEDEGGVQLGSPEGEEEDDIVIEDDGEEPKKRKKEDKTARIEKEKEDMEAKVLGMLEPM
ncbi:MAG: DEAD/DEAH box helicase [Candidatus Pacebacteria bacterium]|nr:DEAD/DEAH box helicase [Candidatus Paceibacterota bacterium]